MAPDSGKEPRGEKRKWESRPGGRSAKRRDMARKDWDRQDRNKRGENTERQERIQREHEEGKRSALPKPFAQEDIDKEERKPKHKTAVLIGYSGTGYKGMQITPNERTIEGDLFKAFVEAGAISKANANDPKKSQLVRCARTDKGVHAAGNVISLKLIIGDPDIVEKINSHLSPQIRVWGIQRTVNSFSAYHACDSRWYEYLIPTYSFLAPHPSSYLARKLREIADDAKDIDAYEGRQREMIGWWEKVEEEMIKPILDQQDEDIKQKIHEALYETDCNWKAAAYESQEIQEQLGFADNEELSDQGETPKKDRQHLRPDSGFGMLPPEEYESGDESEDAPVHDDAVLEKEAAPSLSEASENGGQSDPLKPNAQENDIPPALLRKRKMDEALRSLRKAYQSAKRSYRIQPERLARIQPILDEFLGTKNFHNYTVEKSFRDPSAKRHIRSWKVNATPIVIKGTEWLSLKIHGQSFMMHQIRKMVAMVALVVRCGCDPARIREIFGAVNASIPKVPALGLLLERPVFDSYNEGAAKNFSREPIGFEKFEDKIEDFKRREIYQRQFDEEEQFNQFHQFFSHVDNLRDPQLLYLSSRGFEAVSEERARRQEEIKAKGNPSSERPAEKLDSEDEESLGGGEGREG
ncbi:MAG: hypothetical protein Q9162_004958 [Coniocarpon cinnabarinum]